MCTKHSSKHPSLLPGVFTVFCQHGTKSNYSLIVKCYILTLMVYAMDLRLCESQNHQTFPLYAYLNGSRKAFDNSYVHDYTMLGYLQNS